MFCEREPQKKSIPRICQFATTARSIGHGPTIVLLSLLLTRASLILSLCDCTTLLSASGWPPLFLRSPLSSSNFDQDGECFGDAWRTMAHQAIEINSLLPEAMLL
ncbi:uncharacterized protein BO72DRAFT_78245 [Aspergillus fijiensis CBS 313.89]|uniref:Uncharacterized protein n=1 Tax=Aspergillus fijiensis CBS 313.89 TaxID=1448319 RepID=A0A8G1RWR8_9EURO|nr:uncharacterized protein BO72DRAFT_78245 [Aspergillus fijiensis CBS 313.89]RAK78216.1 hypothetical protein BO72DRAFT_78245 [Aspergillus fijiensis CBS 313.89]